MVRDACLFVYLFIASAVCLDAVSDVCHRKDQSSALVGGGSPHDFPDLSDAGSHFVQMSKVATYGQKTASTLQASANATQLQAGRAKSPYSSITPIDCRTMFRPLQMIKGTEGFSVQELDIESGHYTMKMNFPWNIVPGDYADLNACDINPWDDILYCVMRSEGESYLVRMDANKVEFVCLLPAAVWSAGAFAYTGEYFVSMHGSETIVVPPIHEVQGYADKKDPKLKNYRYLDAFKPKDFWHIADSVVVKRQFPGGQGDEYFMSLYGPKLQVAAMDGSGHVLQTWIKHVEPARWDNIFGAGWNFDGEIFFSSNGGSGVYAVPLEELDLTQPDQIIKLVKVGLSDKTDYNDGLDCHTIKNPWSYREPEPDLSSTTLVPPVPTAEPTPAPNPVCTDLKGNKSEVYPCTCGLTTNATAQCTNGQVCTASSDTDGVCAAMATTEPPPTEPPATEPPTTEPPEAKKEDDNPWAFTLVPTEAPAAPEPTPAPIVQEPTPSPKPPIVWNWPVLVMFLLSLAILVCFMYLGKSKDDYPSPFYASPLFGGPGYLLPSPENLPKPVLNETVIVEPERRVFVEPVAAAPAPPITRTEYVTVPQVVKPQIIQAPPVVPVAPAVQISAPAAPTYTQVAFRQEPIRVPPRTVVEEIIVPEVIVPEVVMREVLVPEVITEVVRPETITEVLVPEVVAAPPTMVARPPMAVQQVPATIRAQPYTTPSSSITRQ